MWTRDKVWRALAAPIARGTRPPACLGVSLCCGASLWQGHRFCFAKPVQLPGVFFKFRDSKDLDLGFIFYTVVPREARQVWKTFIEPSAHLKGQERSQAIILILRLSTQPSLPGGKHCKFHEDQFYFTGLQKNLCLLSLFFFFFF